MAEAKIIRALGSFKLLAVFIFILLPTSNGGNLLELKFLDPNKQIWGNLESEAAKGMSLDPRMVEHKGLHKPTQVLGKYARRYPIKTQLYQTSNESKRCACIGAHPHEALPHLAREIWSRLEVPVDLRSETSSSFIDIKNVKADQSCRSVDAGLHYRQKSTNFTKQGEGQNIQTGRLHHGRLLGAANARPPRDWGLSSSSSLD